MFLIVIRIFAVGVVVVVVVVVVFVHLVSAFIENSNSLGWSTPATLRCRGLRVSGVVDIGPRGVTPPQVRVLARCVVIIASIKFRNCWGGARRRRWSVEFKVPVARQPRIVPFVGIVAGLPRTCTLGRTRAVACRSRSAAWRRTRFDRTNYPNPLGLMSCQ